MGEFTDAQVALLRDSVRREQELVAAIKEAARAMNRDLVFKLALSLVREEKRFYEIMEETSG